eukprot:8757774-Lingulodinium_polyedra.AAC.1
MDGHGQFGPPQPCTHGARGEKGRHKRTLPSRNADKPQIPQNTPVSATQTAKKELGHPHHPGRAHLG